MLAWMDVFSICLWGWEMEVHHNVVSGTCKLLDQMEPDSHYKSLAHHISHLGKSLLPYAWKCHSTTKLHERGTLPIFLMVKKALIDPIYPTGVLLLQLHIYLVIFRITLKWTRCDTLYEVQCNIYVSVMNKEIGGSERPYNCPGLTCGINIVKPRFLFKTVDLWSYILPIDRYSHTL